MNRSPNPKAILDDHHLGASFFHLEESTDCPGRKLKKKLLDCILNEVGVQDAVAINDVEVEVDKLEGLLVDWQVVTGLYFDFVCKCRLKILIVLLVLIKV